MTDPLIRMLANLSTAEPERARADRVRARCHAMLARRPPRRFWRGAGVARLGKPLVASLGAVYLSEVIHQALHVYGIL